MGGGGEGGDEGDEGCEKGEDAPDVDETDVRRQLEQVHQLDVLVQALVPRPCRREGEVRGGRAPLMLSWSTMLGWYICHSWDLRNMLVRSWASTWHTWSSGAAPPTPHLPFPFPPPLLTLFSSFYLLTKNTKGRENES